MTRGLETKIAWLGCLALVCAACGDTGPNAEESPLRTQNANSAPTIDGSPSAYAVSGEVYAFTPAVNDADGDRLEISAEGVPAWLSFSAETGSVYGSPGFDDLGVYRDVTITVSDGEATSTLGPFSIEVGSPKFHRDNLAPTGEVIETEDGFAVKGNLDLEFAGREQTIEDADLQVTVDENGDLLDVFGEGTLPEALDDNVRLDASVSTTMGLLTGAEVNEDERFDVTLMENRQYLVYYLDYGVTLEIDNPWFPGQKLTVSAPPVPYIPKFLIIQDPYDPMIYYGDGGDFAYAFSAQGLLPFVPSVDHPMIKPFEGHHYLKGTVSLGFKVFDFFSFTGDRTILDPRFEAVKVPDLFEHPEKDRIGIKAGFNGAFQFDFSIGPVGLFSFDIGQATAVLEFNQANQYFVMTGYIAPDVSWAPAWMPFVPESSITAELTWELQGGDEVAGVDTIEAYFTGDYRSTLPKADVEGTILLTRDGATLEGIVRDRIDIPVSVTFEEGVTRAEVDLNLDFTNEVDDAVDGAFDRAENALDDAIEDLEKAAADYDLEVSLRGLRSSLPHIADTAIARLSAIPTAVHDAVEDEVVDQINDNRTCFVACVPSNKKRDQIAGDAADSAKAKAEDRISGPVRAMRNLKRRAQEADDESLRAALKAALEEAYANRKLETTISVTVDIVGKKKTVSETVSKTIIDADKAAKIREAADNAHRIQETSDLVISTQVLVDTLPTREAVASVREKVEKGAAQVPSLDAVGYQVVDGEYTAFVRFGDGTEHHVELNVLNLPEAIAGISDLMVSVMVD